MNHGLILDKPVPNKDYVFGGDLRLGGDPIVPDGQWDQWVPADEMQNLAMEPMACATFGTLNCVETLERQEFGDTRNYSDRFLANVSGTTQMGNSPQTVAETLRKKGCVYESDWPYTSVVDTWEKFYSTIPQRLYTLALTFVAEFAFGHEYVGTDQQSMMDALKFSPLGVDVFAWVQDTNGLYYRPANTFSDHWVMIYGYDRNNHWKCFDSYDNTHKKLRWDFGFAMVKRYTLHRQVVNETAWTKFLSLIRSLWPL